jgi:hypothetical protein
MDMWGGHIEVKIAIEGIFTKFPLYVERQNLATVGPCLFMLAGR